MWYVLHAAPHSEHRVCKYLSLLGVQTYAPQFPPPPRTKPGSVRDGRHRWVFPGYVFFRTPADFRQWSQVRVAPGVRRLLDEDGGPALLRDDVIDHLRRRLAERELGPRRTWEPGQPVTVLHGPLRMMDAIFERELDAPSRVRILVQLLGRQLPVEVDPAVLTASP